ncbi:MAG: hypothetical protein AB7K67_16745 [Hyphomicrobiaceae bacterium]|jgi:hypothetical protein
MVRLPVRLTGLAAVAILAASLGGCADGVELNGKVFDWLGVSPAALEASKREDKLPDRAGLVMPPDFNRLPAPGSEPPPQETATAAWPDDPDKRKARTEAERKRLHLAYCRGELNWKDRAMANKDGVQQNRSPYGPCPSLFGGVKNVINNAE